MSFEGYYQVVCKNGHSHTEDCYAHPIFIENDRYIDPIKPVWTCPNCDEVAMWSNLVDTTNGSYDEDGTRIDGYVELEKITPADAEAEKEMWRKQKLVHDLAESLGLKVIVVEDSTYKVPEGACGHFYKYKL